MKYYIWNKEDSVMGLSANVLLNSRIDFKHDDVIVIYKNNDRNNVVMMESAKELKYTYDIDSNDPDVIGYLVSVILTQEDHKTIQEALEELDEENKKEANDDEVVDEYKKLLEDIIRAEIEKGLQAFDDPEINETHIPLKGQYVDPECNVIDLSDVDEAVDEKKLTVVLKHAFVADSTTIVDLKCMDSFNKQVAELKKERDAYQMQSNEDGVETTNRKLSQMYANIEDSCDATLNIEANKVYQYKDSIIVDCTNGQTIIIDKWAYKSAKTSSISYEKFEGSSQLKRKVFYKTVNVELSECYNEVVERGNTLFVISI